VDTLVGELPHCLLVLAQEAHELCPFLVPLATLLTQLTPEPLDLLSKPVALLGEASLFDGKRGEHSAVARTFLPCLIRAHPILRVSSR